MNSTMIHLSTPNKRKHCEERDDDVIVTPSSSYDTDTDDSVRDTEAFVSTPCPTFVCESPTKRRKTAMPGPSQLSPPLMPRLHYRPSSLLSRQNERSLTFARGRPVLDLFDSDGSSMEQPENDLSSLAIPTPPSNTSEKDDEKIPTFELSPRTTLAPRFPEMFDSRRLFGPHYDEEKENELNGTKRRLLPFLRMRPTSAQKHRLGSKPMLEELTLPALTEVALQEQSRPERRSSLPAVAA